MFRNKLDDLRTFLRLLKTKGIIEDGTYYDYMLLIWRAKTIDQLDQIALDLAEIGTPLDHSFSIQ
ncbi:MAG: hypothetical protein GTN74_10500 [Proteobacteria bacterium]|nr:hypothetical protein [Pseudomonadota bacterium]NIS70574.1 hypothetical protein [Pseudomonadota bacterium]